MDRLVPRHVVTENAPNLTVELGPNDIRVDGDRACPEPQVVTVRVEATQGLLDRMAIGVARFNREIVGVPLPDRPQVLSDYRLEGRTGHMAEELEEFRAATRAGDLREAADGLIDLIYVALGTLYEMGVPAGPAFDEVQRANMERVRGDNPERRPNQVGFDAVKPDGWTPPDHSWLDLASAEVTRLGRAAQVRGLTVDALSGMSDAFIKATRMRTSKGQDYNTSIQLTDYFPFGHYSYAQMCRLKSTRMMSLLEVLKRGGTPNFDGLEDTILDALNYESFYWEALNRGDDL